MAAIRQTTGQPGIHRRVRRCVDASDQPFGQESVQRKGVACSMLFAIQHPHCPLELQKPNVQACFFAIFIIFPGYNYKKPADFIGYWQF